MSVIFVSVWEQSRDGMRVEDITVMELRSSGLLNTYQLGCLLPASRAVGLCVLLGTEYCASTQVLRSHPAASPIQLRRAHLVWGFRELCKVVWGQCQLRSPV